MISLPIKNTMRKKYGFGPENTGTLTDTLQTWRVVSSRADVTAAVRKNREVFRRTHINHNYRVVGTVRDVLLIFKVFHVTKVSLSFFYSHCPTSCFVDIKTSCTNNGKYIK